MASFPESDKEFISHALIGLEEGYDPGLVSALGRIESSPFIKSRSIHRKGKREGSSEIIQQQVGTVIPIDANMHLIWFITGDILIAEPSNPQAKLAYKTAFSPNNDPYIYFATVGDKLPGVDQIIKTLESGSDSSKCKVILRNDKPENEVAIAEFQAFAIQEMMIASEIPSSELTSNGAKARTADLAVRELSQVFSITQEPTYADIMGSLGQEEDKSNIE